MRKAPPSYDPIRHGVPLAEGNEITLDAAAMRGIAFREINPKEAFTIVDGEGNYFRASLTSADGRAIVYERMKGSPESPARITLLCAVLGRQRMILVTQKATELGVVRVVPVLSDHSVKPGDLEHEKPWAWPGQALKGARQCRRASVPEVLAPQRLELALPAPFWKSAAMRFVLDDRVEGGGDPFPSPQERPTLAEYVLAVGPEGGWSARELDLFRASGAVPLVLGARVLRAETAAIAGLAILQHRLGDLGPKHRL